MNFLGKIPPSPESAAKEQAPDGRQGSWRWFQFLVDFGQEGPPHLLEEHQRNCQEKAKIDLINALFSVTLYLFVFRFEHEELVCRSLTSLDTQRYPAHILEENLSLYWISAICSPAWSPWSELCAGAFVICWKNWLIWSIVLSYHQMLFFSVPRNPASLAAWEKQHQKMPCASK